MKFFRFLSKVFIFIIGALVALWIFMPWGSIGEYGVLTAERIAESRGFDARHTSVTGSWNGPNIKINGFIARMGLGGGEFETVSLTPSFSQSLFQFSPVVSVSFTGGKLLMPGGDHSSMGSGKVEISLKNGILLLKNFKSTGDLAFDGDVAIDINGLRVDHADLKIKTPENLEIYFNTVKAMLPLTQESKGQWTLKREKDNE